MNEMPGLMGMAGLWLGIPVTDGIVLILAISLILAEYKGMSKAEISQA